MRLQNKLNQLVKLRHGRYIVGDIERVNLRKDGTVSGRYHGHKVMANKLTLETMWCIV